MRKSGKGLASWDPRPRKPYATERGVSPGDVGTFSAEGGFKKIFNILDDERFMRALNVSRDAYPPLKLNVVTHAEELPLGHTIVQGTSTNIKFTSDGSAVTSGAFRCLSSQGAVLLLPTSSADLEELDNHMELRDFIINNPSSLYRYANSIRRLDDHESLYVITGCIKSDSWALAAFKDPVDPLNDVLNLVQTNHNSDNDISDPTHVWTSRGTAETRTGSNPTRGQDSYKGKNQCLFLRGYKLAFSQAFRSRMKDHPPGPGGSEQGGDFNPDSFAGVAIWADLFSQTDRIQAPALEARVLMGYRSNPSPKKDKLHTYIRVMQSMIYSSARHRPTVP
ncbi:hypothetical protein EST38_g11639 [Candolleomyces aberdarensis]|uniref:Uncharacterized protein n=1 Tax=Candolleomyces aberdarensis TaxID=2316362 RepID=A0A4V1Q286_9AGAR|nr:hypothetical protein EST38_g11639 [Candolleomyces aberdarensis]